MPLCTSANLTSKCKKRTSDPVSCSTTIYTKKMERIGSKYKKTFELYGMFGCTTLSELVL